MSYDATLQIDTGGVEPATVEDIANYTSNVSPMFRLAFGHTLRDLDGLQATEAGRRVKNAIAFMLRHPSRFDELNPTNGWGDREGTIHFLRKIADACERHPRATLRIYF